MVVGSVAHLNPACHRNLESSTRSRVNIKIRASLVAAVQSSSVFELSAEEANVTKVLNGRMAAFCYQNAAIRVFSH